MKNFQLKCCYLKIKFYSDLYQFVHSISNKIKKKFDESCEQFRLMENS